MATTRGNSPPRVRRVVTGHDAGKLSKVIWDKQTTNARQVKPGLSTTVIWSTDRIPADISAGENILDSGIGREIHLLPNGTQFVVVDFAPGVKDVWHRTETVDYIVVISGEVDLAVEGSVTHLRAGDVVVQRGTNHAWYNRGDSPARIAAVLIDAGPLGIGRPSRDL